jgi:hypothetical protein
MAAVRLADEVAPQPSADRAQRLARPPGEAQPFAARDLAAADRGKHLGQGGRDFRRGTHAVEVDAEPLAGVRLLRRWRQQEPQHR